MSTIDLEMVMMEEGRKEKIGTEERAGEISEGSDQSVEKGNKLSDNAEENLKSLDGLLIDGIEPTAKTRNPRIPDVMRNNQNLKKYLEPRVVSIGPYHHEKENLKVTKEVKHKLAATFIKEHGVNKKDVYLDILREIEDMKKCYELDEKQDYSDDDLAWMFLIDGCVILLFIYSSMFNGREIIKDLCDENAFEMDMLLLENQLPYRVLKLLVNASKHIGKLERSIKYFIAPPLSRWPTWLSIEEPHHLLDLMRTTLIESDKESSLAYEESKIKFLPAGRSILELKEAGIKLKCSDNCYLTDISFSGGTLKLPLIVIYELTRFQFLNLVAHELSSANFEVSAYLFFLSTLIVGVEDVKELRINKILLSFNVRDTEIVELFNEIRDYEKFGTFAAKHCHIRQEILNYCSKSYHAWIGELKSKHFESPWTVIALVGAIIALSMTILQTIYTILASYK